MSNQEPWKHWDRRTKEWIITRLRTLEDEVYRAETSPLFVDMREALKECAATRKALHQMQAIIMPSEELNED